MRSIQVLFALAAAFLAQSAMAQGGGPPAGVGNNILELIAALDARVATLEAEQGRVSPDADLTGSTYCIFGQGTWLFAEPGVSATVTANPFSARLDFTSATQLTVTGIYDPITSLHFPFLTLVDDEDDLGAETITYTVVGNVLTLIFTDNGESEAASFTMTPDAQVFVSGFFERSMDADLEAWETGMIVGVQAASCD